MRLLGEASAFKSSVPKEVQQLLDGKGKQYGKSKVKFNMSTAEEIEACELMLQDHFNKMANNVDTVNLGFPNVLLNTDTLDDVGDLGGGPIQTAIQ